jgi:ABC-type phosphate/phosphonate transport system ATPase subunit
MIKRTSCALFFEYLKIFPVVAIIGPRQSGKTTLTQELASETWRFFDLEKGTDFDMISRDPVICSPTDALNIRYRSDLQLQIMQKILVIKPNTPDF